MEGGLRAVNRAGHRVAGLDNPWFFFGRLPSGPRRCRGHKKKKMKKKKKKKKHQMTISRDTSNEGSQQYKRKRRTISMWTEKKARIKRCSSKFRF